MSNVAREEYLAKLRDPRWQRKRLEILQRDEWTCQICEATEHTLHVHHRFYLPGHEPWEYPDHVLVTLCEFCHQQETEHIAENVAAFVIALKARGLFSSDFLALAAAIGHGCEWVHTPEVVASVLCDFFEDETVQRAVVQRYMDTLAALASARKAGA